MGRPRKIKVETGVVDPETVKEARKEIIDNAISRLERKTVTPRFKEKDKKKNGSS